jgi:hypothetical protein
MNGETGFCKTSGSCWSRPFPIGRIVPQTSHDGRDGQGSALMDVTGNCGSEAVLPHRRMRPRRERRVIARAPVASLALRLETEVCAGSGRLRDEAVAWRLAAREANERGEPAGAAAG